MPKDRHVHEWEDFFSPHDNVQTPEVEEKFTRKAMAVLMQCLNGKDVPAQAFRAAELVISRKIWPTYGGSGDKHLHLHGLTREEIDEAKRRAGLLNPPGEKT